MTKEELYKLSLDSYYEYPLLAELMAIRDERFKDEQQDSMLCVNGYVGVDTLNNYVKLQQENKKLKEVIDKAIEYINKYESIKAYYEYIDEDGYDEYNYDEDFKKELLDILKEVSE